MGVIFPGGRGLMSPTPYHHVAIGTGSRTIAIAGQTGHDAQGELVGAGDLAAQTAQALQNVATALAWADATFDDVIRLTFYVVDWHPENMDAFLAGIAAAVAQCGLPAPMPPASLIGVESLFAPGVLIEVEATAVT